MCELTVHNRGCGADLANKERTGTAPDQLESDSRD